MPFTRRPRPASRFAALSAAALSLLPSSRAQAPIQPPPGYPPLPAASRAFTRDRDWRDEIIYFVVLDRFASGRSDNDRPRQTDRARPTFYHGGDLAGLTRRLDYIQGLGATAVWLTPIYRQVGRVGDSYGYHGYWFEDPTAIDPQFGTAAEFRELIRQAHRRGLKIILDLVVNHPGYGATVTREQPGWFHTDADRARPGAVGDEVMSLAGLPDFKQEDPAAAAYLKRTVKHWLNEYDLDGVRLDTVKHVPHFFWRDLIREVDTGVGMKNGRGRPELFWLGEALYADLRKEIGDYQADGFESMFDFPLRSDVVAVFGKGGSVDRLAEGLTYDRYYPAPHRMTTLLDNHDVTRFLNEPGFGVPEDEIRARQLLAFDFVFTVRGIPQIFYGNEIGMYGGGDPDNRRDFPDWAFDAARRNAVTTRAGFVPFPRRTFDHVARLCRLRKSSPALYRGAFHLLRTKGQSRRNALAYLRSDPATGNRVLVSLNNDRRPTGPLPIPLSGLPASDRAALADGQVLDDLAGGKPVTITRGAWRADCGPLASRLLRPRAPGPALCRVDITAAAGGAVGPDEDVLLAGDAPELGGWDPSRAVLLRRNAGGAWAGSVRYLRRGQRVAFKLLRVQRGTGRVAWESGPNRAFVVPNRPAAQVTPSWRP